MTWITKTSELIRHFSFLTVHPEFIESYFKFGVFASVSKQRIVDLATVNLRSFASDRHGTVDDTPYGGGDGMVLSPIVLSKAIRAEQSRMGTKPRVVLACPKGKVFHQRTAEQWALSTDSFIFVCGRFGGVDQRFIDRYVTDRVSMGDYILAGGELAALAMADAALRLLPGALGNAASSVQDSFSGEFAQMLEYPLYTRPPIFEGVEVPQVLLSGNHQKIAAWRKQMAILESHRLRPELIEATFLVNDKELSKGEEDD